MAVSLNAATLRMLKDARAESLGAHEGLIGPKDTTHVAKPLRRWGKYIEGKNPVSLERDDDRRAMVARIVDHQFRYMVEKARRGDFHSVFRLQPELRHVWEGRRNLLLAETTTSGDIATFTQQVLAFVMPVFERIVIDQLVHMRAMQGPTAFVHSLDFQVGTAGGAYAQGTSFSGNLDINYSDCPTECTDANEVDLVLTSTTITAVCKRLMAKWCLPAGQDYASQHGRSLPDDVRGMIQLQMARERQGEVLNTLVAGAGYSGTWSSTIPVGSVYNTLDPKAYEATLYDALIDADNEIFKSADSYRGANWIAGDPDSLTRLSKLKKFTITTRDNVARSGAGTGDIDEFGGFFGTANMRYALWKFPFMTSNTILMGVKSDAPQELGFVHAEYVPLFDLGIFLDPGTGEYKTGMQSRYANAMIRSGLYAKVTIT